MSLDYGTLLDYYNFYDDGIRPGLLRLPINFGLRCRCCRLTHKNLLQELHCWTIILTYYHKGTISNEIHTNKLWFLIETNLKLLEKK